MIGCCPWCSAFTAVCVTAARSRAGIFRRAPAEKGLLLVKRRQLKEAVEAEKYEDAAVLRDEIRALEAEHDGHDA